MFIWIICLFSVDFRGYRFTDHYNALSPKLPLGVSRYGCENAHCCVLRVGEGKKFLLLENLLWIWSDTEGLALLTFRRSSPPPDKPQKVVRASLYVTKEVPRLQLWITITELKVFSICNRLLDFILISRFFL